MSIISLCLPVSSGEDAHGGDSRHPGGLQCSRRGAPLTGLGRGTTGERDRPVVPRHAQRGRAVYRDPQKQSQVRGQDILEVS